MTKESRFKVLLRGNIQVSIFQESIETILFQERCSTGRSHLLLSEAGQEVGAQASRGNETISITLEEIDPTQSTCKRISSDFRVMEKFRIPFRKEPSWFVSFDQIGLNSYALEMEFSEPKFASLACYRNMLFLFVSEYLRRVGAKKDLGWMRSRNIIDQPCQKKARFKLPSCYSKSSLPKLNGGLKPSGESILTECCFLGKKLRLRLLEAKHSVGVQEETVVQAAALILLARYARTETPALKTWTFVPGSEIEGGEKFHPPYVPRLAAADFSSDLRVEQLFRNLETSRRESLEEWKHLLQFGSIPTQFWHPEEFASMPEFMLWSDDEFLPAGASWVNQAKPFGGLPLPLQGDLSLEIGLTDCNLEVRVHGKSSLFDSSSLRRLLGHYDSLLCELLSGKATVVSELRMLQPYEHDLVARTWSRALPRRLCGKSALARFEEIVRTMPEHIAAESQGEKLSYGKLNERAENAAAGLKALGVESTAIIGLFAEKSLEFMVGFVAIFKMGGTYLPLSPELPPKRLHWMIEDAEPQMILTDRDLNLEKAGAPCWRIHGLEKLAANSRQSYFPEYYSTSRIAYVIYTSGSTGRPKGVKISHENLAYHLEAQHQLFSLEPKDRILQLASINFDMSMMEICISLCNGCCLILEKRENLIPGDDLARVLREKRISFLLITPSVLSEVPETDLNHIRTLMIGGEACPPKLIAKWGRSRLAFNAYGPTEATMFATAFKYQGSAEKVSIGRPVVNASAYVVDLHGQLTPVDVPGELWIGGAGVGQGYLNQPDLTCDRFAANPFDPSSEERIYKTGDLCRWNRSGNLEILGRIDQQVKIRGFRIEIGEIEQVLSDDPDVLAANVLVVGEGNRRRLKAFVQLVGDKKTGESDVLCRIREKAETQLPKYMIPSEFILLDELPLAPSGKIDRKSLISKSNVFERERNEVLPPESIDAEGVLAEIWKQVLGHDNFTNHDNFFDVGGHSLLLQQVRDEVSQRLQVKIKLIDLLTYPSIESLTQFLHVKRSPTGAQPLSFSLGSKEQERV